MSNQVKLACFRRRHFKVFCPFVLLFATLPVQEDGMMDHETDGDGAINLSTSQRPSAATTPVDLEQDADQVYSFDLNR